VLLVFTVLLFEFGGFAAPIAGSRRRCSPRSACFSRCSHADDVQPVVVHGLIMVIGSSRKNGILLLDADSVQGRRPVA